MESCNKLYKVYSWFRRLEEIPQMLLFNKKWPTFPCIRPDCLIARHLLRKMEFEPSKQGLWGLVLEYDSCSETLGGLTRGFRVQLAHSKDYMTTSICSCTFSRAPNSYQIPQLQTWSIGSQISQAHVSLQSNSYRRQVIQHLAECQSFCTVIAVTIMETRSKTQQSKHFVITPRQKESM